MSVFHELPDELFKELSDFYIKYINVKQDNSEDNQQPNSPIQNANKFEFLFKQIEKIISNVVDDTLKKKPSFCSDYQTRYKEFFQSELSIVEKNSTKEQFYKIKKQLIAYMIGVIQKINPDQLPTYGNLVKAETCGIGYQPVLVQYLDKIKEKIKENSLALLFTQIKDIAKEEIKSEVEEIDNVVGILDGEKSEINEIDKIKHYISDILDIPYSEIEVNSENIVNELTKRYNEFLSIQSNNFSQEIKNKIKKSVVEIVLIEYKIKKMYNPKKPLLFYKAIKEFFEK
jgi:hypothetical protein